MRERSLPTAALVTCPRALIDPELWRQMQWGLADPKQEGVLKKLLPGIADREARERIALEHQRKCLRRARQFHQALDVPAAPPPGVTLHLFAGDSLETPAAIAVDIRTGTVEVGRTAPGDDTTTRQSALMNELPVGAGPRRSWTPIQWTSTMFLHSSHLGLTSDPIFADNVLALLLEARGTLPLFAAPPRAGR